MPFLFRLPLLPAIALYVIFTAPAMAQVSEDLTRLLTLAAQQNNGAQLDMVADLAIAANPDAQADIMTLVNTLKQQTANDARTGQNVLASGEGQGDAAPTGGQDDSPEDHGGFFSGWEGEAELNVLHTSGNTEQKSFGMNGKLERDSDSMYHTIESFFYLNKNADITDRQRWGLSYKLDYDVSERLYVTSFAGYENDQFGAFRERITTSLGIGYPFIEQEDFSWKVEGGPSLLLTKELPGDGYSSSLNAFVNSILKWSFNERSELTNQSVVYFGNRHVVESKSALKVKINGALSSKFSYDIFYDRDAPLGREKTDTVARVGLLYDF